MQAVTKILVTVVFTCTVAVVLETSFILDIRGGTKINDHVCEEIAEPANILAQLWP